MIGFIKCLMFVIGIILGSIGFVGVILGGLGDLPTIMASGLFLMVIGTMLSVKGME
jgi:branched-subunit amino acid ABC-type transport system permease component